MHSSPNFTHSGPSPSQIVDDVAALDDFQHRFEFGVRDDVHRRWGFRGEMPLDAHLYQMEARPATRVQSQVEPKQVYVSRKSARDRYLRPATSCQSSQGEQVDVNSDEVIIMHGEEVEVVVLGAKRVLDV